MGMPVNRRLWNNPPLKPVKHSRHKWRCPSCDSGDLHIQAETLHFAETLASRKARGQEEWNPVMDDGRIYRFSGLLECSNRLCLEVVAISGRRCDLVEIDHSVDPDSREDLVDVSYREDFQVDYVSPSPPLIAVPENSPTALKIELDKAFVASWGDLPAAANHARSAVEKLLDHLGELKITITKQGKRKELSLGERIQNLKARDPERGEVLRAVKWLGNAGSHADHISRDELYHAFDIIEAVLKDVFSRDYTKVQESVDAITTSQVRRRR
jgi:hypothetical protein